MENDFVGRVLSADILSPYISLLEAEKAA